MTNKNVVALSQNVGCLNKGVGEWMGVEVESYRTEDDVQNEGIEVLIQP